MNIVKASMQSYLSCKKWLSDHDYARKRFVSALNTMQGINYEEKSGGNGMTMDMRNSIIADEIDRFDKEHKHNKSQSEATVLNCEYWFTQVDDEFKHIFTMWMKQGLSSVDISKNIFRSRQWVDKVINSETERLTNNK